MIIVKNLRHIIRVPELLHRLLFTLGVLVIYRIGASIPVSGINVALVAEHMNRSLFSGILSNLDTFSGGALHSCALFALGIGPYISASIAMQILSMTIPMLEQLAKEGEFGRKILNQYTRYLTLGLSILYSTSFLGFLERSDLVLYPGIPFKLFFILCLTTGAMMVMWLGEQISLMGLGSGSSVLIFASIVSAFPSDVLKTIEAVKAGNLTSLMAYGILIFFVAVAACIIYLEKGDRKIPVHYARRVIGQRVYGGQSTYIPFKINTVGVMPVIFASTFLQFPAFIAGLLAKYFPIFEGIAQSLNRGALYNVLTFALIIFFTFMYTSMIYDPNERAEDIKKSGGFIPGIRPGKQTAEFFDYILTRIGLVGAVYLAILALLPTFAQSIIPMPFTLSGTSLLIVVGVALELSSQIESYLLEHNYAGFLTSGNRLKSRVGR